MEKNTMGKNTPRNQSFVRSVLRPALWLAVCPLLLSALSCRPETAARENTLRVKAVRVKADARGVSLLNLPESGESLRLDVVGERIVRVRAVPGTRFPDKNSLMCIWKPAKTAFQWYCQGDTLYLETTSIRLAADTRTGRLEFRDAEGNLLLREAAGGRHFEPRDGDDGALYGVQQRFDPMAGESFYGLGQHQSGEMDYKNRHESLYQYNTKVSVPFVVSTRGYGLLWDNTSFSRWGDERPYAPLSQFLLRDKDGTEGALTVTYTRKRDASRALVCRDSVLAYEDLESVRLLPAGLNLSQVEARWEGSLEAKQGGDYSFDLYYAGYVSLWVDDSLVVAERWRTAWNPNHYKFSLPLETGRPRRLRLDWNPDGGSSYLSLKALSSLPEERRGGMAWWSEAARDIDYYVVAGQTADEVVSGYRYLTGKAQVMPLWAMGFWQSRERYKTQDELIGTLAEFRRRHIPIDNIVLDWSYWKEDQWGSHAFDAERFPSPRAMVDSVHALDGRVMISVWPKFYVNTEHYRELDRLGAMYHQAVADSVRDWIGKGYIGSFYDAFSAKARRLYWRQMQEHLWPLGFDAWWMDASEPDILSNASMDYRQRLMNPTAIGSAEEVFNAYGLMNAKGIYEGQRGVEPDRRVFLLTRSGYAGSQAYGAAVWSGDIATRWEDMAAQVVAGMNYSVSGNPYWTMDNGGFCVERRYTKAKEGSRDREEWRELNVRWHQFGAFCPLFRTHGQYPYREIWNIAPEGHPAYETMLYYTRLRYRLMPYIYSLAGACHWSDYTMMRPLAMDFPEDLRLRAVADQYMFGPSLLVAPVCRYGARQRNVLLPEGRRWYHLYDGRSCEGGTEISAEAPYDRMPVWVPSGSVLPIGNAIEHTAQVQDSVLLLVYTGRDAAFDLYRDDGVSYGYEKGACSWYRIRYREANGRVSVQRVGTWGKAPELRYLLVSERNPIGLDSAPFARLWEMANPLTVEESPAE